MAIRENDGLQTLLCLLDMLRIFMITEQNEYSRSLLLHIQVLVWASKNRSPLWEVWKRCQPALNEELCEQQLSSLARTIHNDTTGGKLAFTDNHFKLGSIVADVLRLHEPERMTSERNSRSKWRDFIEPDDEDLKQVELYFKGRIRQLKTSGQFLSYTGPMSEWKSSRHASETNQYKMPAKTFLQKMSSKFIALCKRVRNLAIGRWADVTPEHWSPEVEPEEPFPEQAPSAEELDMVLNEMAAAPEVEDIPPSSPGAEEPVQEFPDFKDVKAIEEAKHAAEHPTVVLFNEGREPAPNSSSESSASSSSASDTKSKKARSKKPKKGSSTSSSSAAQDSSSSPSAAPPSSSEVEGSRPLNPDEELEFLLRLADQVNPAEESTVRQRSQRKRRKAAEKPAGWHFELEEEDYWESEEDD